MNRTHYLTVVAPLVRCRIAAKYNDQTELVADVKSGRNTFDFDVKPK